MVSTAQAVPREYQLTFGCTRLQELEYVCMLQSNQRVYGSGQPYICHMPPVHAGLLCSSLFTSQAVLQSVYITGRVPVCLHPFQSVYKTGYVPVCLHHRLCIHHGMRTHYGLCTHYGLRTHYRLCTHYGLRTQPPMITEAEPPN